MNIKNLLFLILSFTITSCNLDPKYKTPEVALPFEESKEEKESISLIPWQKFFKSEELQKVINLALENNRDLKVASLNVDLARASHDVVRANLFPTINGTALATRQGVPSAFASFTPRTQYRANLNLASYELDFFGRLRSLKRSALEDFLATNEAKEVVKISLITEVVNSYITLLSNNEILSVATLAIEAQQKKFDLIKKQYESGVAAKADFLNAKATLENAKMTFENYQKIAKQDKNNLLLLTGVFDEKLLPLNTSFDKIEIDENLLSFLPSKTLLSRPDIKQAEHKLRSANANIGAARAAFFPSITLTGNYGYGARDLSDLLSSKTWSITPQINLPIFTGGKNISNLKIADIKKKIEIINYEKAIQTAFREASDRIAERQATKNRLELAENILTSQENLSQISKAKYEAGVGKITDKMDAEILSASAKQNRIATKREYMMNLIETYKAMGGGSEVF
ncbi:MAG: TolC family protein [Rickettsiales bacterium]|nr:TolC family protein [Rickettsiales bacterium]